MMSNSQLESRGHAETPTLRDSIRSAPDKAQGPRNAPTSFPWIPAPRPLRYPRRKNLRLVDILRPPLGGSTTEQRDDAMLFTVEELR
jgi:hypothetical protein